MIQDILSESANLFSNRFDILVFEIIVYDNNRNVIRALELNFKGNILKKTYFIGLQMIYDVNFQYLQ